MERGQYVKGIEVEGGGQVEAVTSSDLANKAKLVYRGGRGVFISCKPNKFYLSRCETATNS